MIGLIACMATGVFAESALDPLNDAGVGTFSAKIQSVNMYRDYENNTPQDAGSATLGAALGYESPERGGFSIGGTYIYAEPLVASDDSNHGKTLLANGRVNIVNEAWVQWRFDVLGMSNTTVRAGRQVVNDEVFYSATFRQKPMSIEAIRFTSKDVLPATSVSVGHAWRLSNWVDNDGDWLFRDFDNVLGIRPAEDSRGLTWGDLVYTGMDNLEVAVFDAYVHNILNMMGMRTGYEIVEGTTVVGYYRHENSIDDTDVLLPYDSDMFSMALQQKIGDVNTEFGYFGVYGDDLKLGELSTGIRHPLGLSMIIYGNQFAGGADTVYAKATTKVGKLSLYGLFNHTWHSRQPYSAQEINGVASYPLTDKLTAAVKLGVGFRDYDDGSDDRIASDSRLFLTYTF